MEYAIETYSLSKTFSDKWGRARVRAVDELSLKIRRNEVFGLLGPNGSGKTTTIKMLLGLLYPTKGRVVVLGGDSTDPKISAKIGFMPEESYLYRYLNARETLDFYGRLFKLPSRVRKDRIEALLDMVGLKAVANRAVGTYSKGMARRIGLAQALINDPDMLILDEPTTGLDPIGTRQIKDLIIQLAKRGKTILLCSHLLADVEDVCDRISILYGGKVQAQGKVSELLRRSDKKQIIASSISDEAIAQIQQIIEKETTQFEISSPMDKLETFFIDTVTAAQSRQQATSGSISTTNIGDFLSSGDSGTDAGQRILEKLVSASYSDEQPKAGSETPSTQTVQAAQSDPRPNEELLSSLMGKATIAPTDEVVGTDPVETPSDSSNQINKNVLDDLMKNTGDVELERVDDTQAGEESDA